MQQSIDNKTLWDKTLTEIELGVSKANFVTWFRDTHLIKYNDGTVIIGVPNSFAKEWLTKKFSKIILKSLRDQVNSIKSIEFKVIKSDKQKEKSVYSYIEIPTKNGGELPLSEFYINKEDNLNPRYTFETFIIGSFNEVAYAASQAVMKQPGIVYNPLFIHGSTGHGKTHLIQAIGNQIKSNSPDKRVYYLTSEKFASEYVYSIQSNKINNFKDRYKKYDVLIMDDVQFLSNKEKTQEELFHLFNFLYENNKQIIFSSDKHPNFIPGLEARLKSRFNQGMIVDIPKPDQESRQAIIKQKAIQNNVHLSDDVVDFLATNIEGNIRELEGVLNSVVMQTQLKNRLLSVNEIKELIKNNTKQRKMLSIKELIRIVAEFYNIDPETICDKTRRKEVVRPRQITMYILREDFNTSYPTIGEKLGNRDHTTVIHSYEKIKRDIKEDPILLQQINQIRSII